MGDRRIGDRREPEKGVIKIPFKNAVIYIVFALILIVSLSANIVLGKLYINYKKDYEQLLESDDLLISDDYEDSDDEEISEESENNYTCNLAITGDKEEVKAGEEVTYEIKATDIQADDGIIMFETAIDYNTEVFDIEVFGDDDENWTQTGMVENYLTMTRKDFEQSSDDQVIAKVKFKVKEEAKADSYTINFTDIKLSVDTDESFIIDDEAIEIKVSE